MASFLHEDASETYAASFSDGPILSSEEREYYLNQMDVVWSRFGGPYPRCAYYGAAPLPGQHPIRWDQMPSSSQPGPSTSTSVSFPLHNPPPQFPEHSRPLPQPTGQSVFRVTVPPNTTPSSSSSQRPEEPLLTRFSILSPPITRCTCSFRAGTPVPIMSRHWAHSCPDNPNLAAYECDFCGVEIKRKDNLKRHLRNVHGVFP